MIRILKYLLVATALLIAYQLRLFIVEGYFTINEKRIISSDHFTIYYHNVSRWDANSVSKALEKNYQRIKEDLKAPVHPKIHVYIHPNKDAFRNEVGFDALGVIKGVDSLHLLHTGFPLSWIMPVEEVAVHEFTHNVTLNVIMQNAVSTGKISSILEFDSLYSRDEKRFDQIYPRWLWESVAVYEADQFSLFSPHMSLRDGFPNLSTLNKSDDLVYYVGHTLVDFIIKRWGREKLLELIKSSGDINATLEITEKEFEIQWESYVRDKFWLL